MSSGAGGEHKSKWADYKPTPIPTYAREEQTKEEITKKLEEQSKGTVGTGAGIRDLGAQIAENIKRGEDGKLHVKDVAGSIEEKKS